MLKNDVGIHKLCNFVSELRRIVFVLAGYCPETDLSIHQPEVKDEAYTYVTANLDTPSRHAGGNYAVFHLCQPALPGSYARTCPQDPFCHTAYANFHDAAADVLQS